MKPKVMFVVETGSLAGGVRVIGEYANRLAERGWPVEIWSVNKKETMSWFPLHKSVKWIDFLRTGTITDYEQLEYVLSRQDGFKIATFWRTAPVASSASKPGEGFYLIQDIETSYTSAKMVKDVVMSTYDMGLHNITTSRWVESNLGRPCDYVGIGIDTDFYSSNGNRRDRLSVIGMARMNALKGWAMMMEVSRKLRNYGASVTLFGSQKGLRLLSGLDGYIIQPSDREVVSLYSSASCFVSTSTHEGFNLTALEAMACGCPVVKTRDDGSDEYCIDGMNCLIGSDGNQIAGKVMSVLSSHVLSDKLAKNGLDTAARYNWRDAVDRLENLLKAS